MVPRLRSGSHRSRALLTLLTTTGLRISEALSRDVEHLSHDRGHHLEGPTFGPFFITSTGKRMGQPEAWHMVRRLAKRAALDGTDEIRPHSLHVQDAASYADPHTTRRYDRGLRSLDRHAVYAMTAFLTEKTEITREGQALRTDVPTATTMASHETRSPVPH